MHRFPSRIAKLKVALCGMTLLGLAACTTPAPKGPATFPTEHYAVKVEEAPDQVALGIHAEGVSVRQQAALSDLVARWRDAGSGAVTIKTPAQGTNADQALAMTYAVQTQLQILGIPADRIQLAAYQPTDAHPADAHPPVLVSFVRLTAEGPDCSGGWDNLVSTNSNEPYKHFGCALTANFAAQVADPRDFVAPPGLAPADNVRRQVILSRYRDGKATSSDKDAQANGAVSSAVAQ